jgi:protein arginine kinase
MELENLKATVGEWLRGGPESDVVLSSRVRLARNVADYPFLSRASERQLQELEEMLHERVMDCGIERELSYHRLDELEPLLRELLMERHLISRDHAEADWVRGVAFDPDERISIMVNEEDHLRLQVVRGGLRIKEVWDEADELDDLLARKIPFAFSDKYGYLTACPTNVGTGMRASAMLHLPGLVMTRGLDRVMHMAEDQEITMRGLFGEGTQGSGDFYQFSNAVSLGMTEEDLVRSVSEMSVRVAEMERDTRESLLHNHPDELCQRVNKGLELLVSASTISSEEALQLLSQVRLGVETGIIDGVPLKQLNQLFLLTLPAHLQTMEGRKLGGTRRNELRAEYVKHTLSKS